MYIIGSKDNYYIIYSCANFITFYFNNIVIQLRYNLEIKNLEINYFFSFKIPCIFSSRCETQMCFEFFVKNKY